QDGHGEAAPRLAELHADVADVLHLGVARVAEDRAAAESTRAALHPPLEPADDLSARDHPRRLLRDPGRPPVAHAARAQRALDLVVPVGGPPEEMVHLAARVVALP